MPPSSPEAPALPPRSLVVIALTPFALGYFLSYLFRAVNAVVAPDLVRDIGLGPADLGLLTAAYLFAFALFQLPLGILLDRYGPRRVQAALVGLAAVGALLFAIGRDAATLTVARAIIGMGFAGGLMSGFKAVVIWVPEPRRAMANAFVMSLGALGLLVATAPMEFAVQAIGWRHVFLGLAAISFVVAAVIFAVVPERTLHAAPVALAQQLREVLGIFRDRVFLALAPLLALTAGTHIAIQTLWAGPWFRDVANLDRMGAANHLFVMAVAFFVGILASGAIADRLTRRGVSLLSVMMGFVAVFLVAQLGIILEIMPINLLLWSLFGMTGQAAILAYPWLSSYFGARLSGRANTAANLLMFLVAFAVQYAIGAVIGLYPPTATGGYAPQSYRVAFAIFFALQLAALGWYALNAKLLRAADNNQRRI